MQYLPYIFSINELSDKFKNKKQLDNWIFNLNKSKKVKKIRNGLYASIDQQGQISISKYEIACKITKDSFLCYHSALEYYGFYNQVFNELYVGSTSKFNSFEFEGITYTSRVIKNLIQVNEDKFRDVRVTSLERTVIDCISNIDLAGGIEELLNALEGMRILDEDKLLEMLKMYDEVFLYQKAGYILEEFKESLMLSDSFFEECKKHLTNQVKYFLDDEYSDIKYNSKWKLMCPVDLKSRLYGGYNELIKAKFE